MSAGIRAKNLLKTGGYAHVIYGYAANGETVLTDWEHEMLKFDDDGAFNEYADKMWAEIEGLDIIYAVHA